MPSNTAKNFTSKNVVFFVYPGVKTLDLVGPLQVFNDANSHVNGEIAYQTSIVSVQGGVVPTDTGLDITSEPASRWRRRKISTLIVIGGDSAQAQSQNNQLISSITTLAVKSNRIASVCSGAFLLAKCRLLDGRRAVTHWQSVESLAKQYPDVTVERDPIYLKDGNVWTSAGVTSGIDLALALVSEDLGRNVALSLARSLVTYILRPGGQSQFSTALEFQTRDQKACFDKLHVWMLNNLQCDQSVEALAEKSNMSSRNFSRLYKAQTGTTPAKAVEHMRVEAARQMLEGSKFAIAKIAVLCGFGDDERMRRSFMRHMYISPSDYRSRFQHSPE